MYVSRISRLLKVLGLLQGGRGENADSLAVACGVSRRTIFRDLDVLRSAGLPLVYDEQSRRYELASSNFLPPTNFTAEEALALMVLCHELGADSGVPFHSPARAAAVKLQSSLPEPLQRHIRRAASAVHIRLEPRNRLENASEVYHQLLRAASERRAVRIRYDSLTEWREISTKVNPYQMLFNRRSWYVVGRSSLHRAVRTFNVGRIRRLDMLEDGFRIPRGFSIDRYLRNAWRLIPERGPDRRVLIRFQKMVAQNVAEVHWHKTQRVKFNADGTLDYRVTVSGLNEICWWVMGYGDQAEVIEPKALRTMVAKRAANMTVRYAGAPKRAAPKKKKTKKKTKQKTRRRA